VEKVHMMDARGIKAKSGLKLLGTKETED